VGLLVAGLADHRQLLAEATGDRLHQADRGSLFPEAASIIEGLVAAGALAACWSGAGPSLLGFCTEGDVGRLTEAARGLLADHGVSGAVLCLAPDLDGVTVEGDPGR
ncbi:MAG: homoserine kinase, partial [Actinomycetota bacterium]|nr:homoserine kinase [Actinomycetota bacterium]